MENTSKRLKRLLQVDKWSQEEEQWLMDYFDTTDAAELKRIMQQSFDVSVQSGDLISPDKDQAAIRLKKIHGRAGIENVNENDQKKPIRIWGPRLAVACIIIVLAGATILFLFTNKNEKPADKEQIISIKSNEILPGADGAVLTLATGEKIVLENVTAGALSQRKDLQITLKTGQLIYETDKTADAISYNTLTTPRGKQYSLVLADGTTAWLNASSSIHYPTSFTGNERKVEITGEVYFEVAKNKEQPFIATVNEMEIKVLGTHFNVNAYEDELLVKTTLLEGLVQVSKGNNTLVLNPGQQAQLSGNGTIDLIKNADVEDAMAWKNGRFLFNNADIKTIMRQIARWYDVDILYEGKVSDRFFTADLSRKTTLQVFLKVLEESDIHFKIEDRKLIVTQ